MLDKDELFETYTYYSTKWLTGKVKLPAMRNMKSKFKKERDILNYVGISAAISFGEIYSGDR